MSWFITSCVCILGWGFADFFYKMSSDEKDRYSHLKIAVWVGLVMGACAFFMLPFSDGGFSFSSLARAALKYSPASLSYIISMVIGYAGLRYLELSICSPLQNASGAFSMIVMIIFFIVTGKISSIGDEFSALDIAGTAVIILAIIALAVVEQRLSKAEREKADKKYKFGALALLFPILYCVFDTVGTAADGIILDGTTGLGLSEIDALIIYGFTFFLAGTACFFIIKIKSGNWYNPFTKKELPRMGAALFEECGQVFYVFAMAARPVLAAPMVACYCIVSVLLARVLLKEKLKAGQYACVIAVIAGIACLGISEGLASA